MGLNLTPAKIALLDPDRFFPSGFMHVPYVSLVNDHTVRLRDNSLMQCVRVEGLDAHTSNDTQLERQADSFAGMLAQLPPGFSIYVHKVSRPISIEKELRPVEGYGFAAEIDARWRAHLQAQGLRDKTLTISIIKHSDALNKVRLFSKMAEAQIGQDDEKAVKQLDEIARYLQSRLGPDQSEVLTAASGQLLGFLNSTTSGREGKILPGMALDVLADNVVTERVTFREDHFELSEGHLGHRYGMIRILKAYGEKAWPTMFDDLALPCDYVITHSYSPKTAVAGAEYVQGRRKRMRATDDGRVKAFQELGVLYEDTLSRNASIGLHHTTVSLLHPELDTLRDYASLLEGVAAERGAIMISDNRSQRGYYFGQLPGNVASRLRGSHVTNTNMAYFASLHRINRGKSGDEVPWGQPVTAFPTVDGSLRRISFHSEGTSQENPTAGHSLVLGKTGYGKTFLIAFLIAQMAKLKTRCFVLDYRQGLEMAMRAMGGSYSVIRSGEATGLNPLWEETDPEGVDWLHDWIARMIKPGGDLSAVQGKRLVEVCRENAESYPNLRNWDEFAKKFTLTDDDGELKGLVEEWTARGRYGWVFGQTLEDTFSLDGNLVGFDLTQILDAESQRERMAVLSYIFRRIERKIRDRERTVIIIDEAWKALDNPYFAEKITDWLATLRKMNAAVILITQNPQKITEGSVGKSVFSHISTQFLFPNPDATEEDFEVLRLGDKELAFVLNEPSSRSFLVRDDRAKSFVQADLSGLGKLAHLLGGGDSGEAVAGPDWRDRPNFWEGIE